MLGCQSDYPPHALTFSGWNQILFDEFFAEQNTQVIVDPERGDCRTANGRSPLEMRPIPTEMPLPLVSSRIEKWRDMAGNWISS